MIVLRPGRSTTPCNRCRRRRDDPLERRRDEAAHEIRVRADVDRRHADDGDVAARILPDAQRADRLQTGDQNHQGDDDRKNGPFDEEIGKAHRCRSAVFRFRCRVVAGLNLVVDENSRGVAQLEHAGCHDFVAGFHARGHGDLIAARAAELDELLAHAAVRRAVRILQVRRRRRSNRRRARS